MYLFKINKERYENLVKLKGWKCPIVTLAKRTGFGKSYISQIINGGLTVSHDFMVKYIEVCGASPSDYTEWACLFELVKEPARSAQKKPIVSFKVPFSKENYKKMRGEVPYDKYSLGGPEKLKDQARSLERMNLPTIIPADQYYGDRDNYWQFKHGMGKSRQPRV